MKPYEIDIEKLKESEEVKGEKEVLKLKLIATFLKITSHMETSEILSKTGLDKSDLSRLRSMSMGRFTIDRIVGLLSDLGHSTDIDVNPKKAS